VHCRLEVDGQAVQGDGDPWWDGLSLVVGGLLFDPVAQVRDAGALDHRDGALDDVLEREAEQRVRVAELIDGLDE
jgi:hypothetical protein